MSLDDIADQILEEWYAAPQLRDFHNKTEPETVENEDD